MQGGPFVTGHHKSQFACFALHRCQLSLGHVLHLHIFSQVPLWISDMALIWQCRCQEPSCFQVALTGNAAGQVHMKVALKPMVQGVSTSEDALELIEYVGACSSLQLRGLAADYGLPQVSRASWHVPSAAIRRFSPM